MAPQLKTPQETCFLRRFCLLYYGNCASGRGSFIRAAARKHSCFFATAGLLVDGGHVAKDDGLMAKIVRCIVLLESKES